ncbi:MAG: helix-turn-helix transcriptional regulator [Oscillospiraceae bacterium]|nr:helix-turn-helix transcriptional regulator [Oscillospiraceae bacterium]
MEIHQAVGLNIHRIRKSQKLSIDRTAELAGISKSMLGQIERGVVNPTVSVLYKLAQGLHVPLEELVAYHEEPGAVLYRSVDTVGRRLNGGKVIRYRLFPYDTDSRCESSQIDIFISGAYTAEDHIPGSRVYLTVISGIVEVQAGEEKWQLDNRDSLMFPGDQPRKYTNKGNTTVRLMERIMYQK